MNRPKILVWLPSPLGDAILCTPALRALRAGLESAHICFLANGAVRGILSPGTFNNEWIESNTQSLVSLVVKVRQEHFTTAVLFKNSFGSAFAAFTAKIPERIGYARDGRGFLLTDKLESPKNPDGSFKPGPMVDYYLAIAEHLGCDTADKQTQLLIDDSDKASLSEKLPGIFSVGSPLVILVPGGTFGPSKRWGTERFAKTADRLIEEHNATVVISVAPDETEKNIAGVICSFTKNKLYNLADHPLTLGELKTLFARADLVITNDTGPRHIAIALKRNVITLFGPNDPAWTETGYDNEIQIEGVAHCIPCGKSKCVQPRHLCMESISIKSVCSAAKKMLAGYPQ